MQQWKDAEEFYLAGGRTGVMLLHGFTGSPGHLRIQAEALHAAGYSVLAPRLKGHGTDAREMADCRAEDWLADAQNGFALLKERCDRVYTGGLSMGGILSLILSAQHPEIAGCISISSPMVLRHPIIRMAPYASWAVRQYTWPEKEKMEYRYGYDQFPTRSVKQLLRLMDQANDELDKIRCPVGCIQSLTDGLVNPRSVWEIARGIGRETVDVMLIQSAPHACTIGKTAERVAQKCVEWIKAWEGQK